MTENTITPLERDETKALMAGKPKSLGHGSSITIERPDAPVNIGNDMVIVDGVPEGDKLE